MDGYTHLPWMVPLLPLIAAGVIAVLPQPRRRLAAGLAIAAQAIALSLAVIALVHAISIQNAAVGIGRQAINFTWFEYGTVALTLGFVLDPLSASMLAMITLITLMVCIYSVGYMADDPNFTRFFGFISLFAGAMLGVIVANSLLLIFIFWELVGLSSFLLIGFWYQKPAAVAAAQKAFITTRIGDLGLLLGMIWLYRECGTLLFYDSGNGLLEQPQLYTLATTTTVGGIAVSTATALLIFCGAVGKSGQFPLHVWLPDAMEGPTPVSALIHAATMVAAGVFLVARMWPLFAATAGPDSVATALIAVTWTGAFTAVFAAAIALAQYDIKRILAYSTVSQLGFMMLCLGVGGVGAAIFHLIGHAFFKALLFLGAGSAIHGCHGEQDIRRMGGLSKRMRVTFAVYAIGMMALAGFPLLFTGFWSKEEILHLALAWPVSRIPFVIGLVGTFLTAFYMTRQLVVVFFGTYRGDSGKAPHESPSVMLWPMGILASGAILLSIVATPAWPWFFNFIEGGSTVFDAGHLLQPSTLVLMLTSIILVAAGTGCGWALYHGPAKVSPGFCDPLATAAPRVQRALAAQLYVNEFYRATVIRLCEQAGRAADLLERYVWAGIAVWAGMTAILLAFLSYAADRLLLNRGFNSVCGSLRTAARQLSAVHRGNIQHYLTTAGAGLVILILLIAWLR